jgi:hypothetical protein
MAKQAKETKRDMYGTPTEKGNYDIEVESKANLKKMSRKKFRDYMAQRNRVQDAVRRETSANKRMRAAEAKGDQRAATRAFNEGGRAYEEGGHRSVFEGKPSKRYYTRFDRNAARYEARKRARKSGRR